MAHLALQRRMRQRFPPVVHALRFSRWKKPIVRTFFDGSEVRFVRRAEDVPAGAALAVWGRRPVSAAAAQRLTLIRLEDGFLRSVGLGVDLVRPVSWVMDPRGIYFDATRPSELEEILNAAAFDAELLARAAALRGRLCQTGLSKYNVGTAAGWRRPAGASRVILVPGQVEADASIALGAPQIRRNIELLRAVREANPDAHVLYKPHPDVVARMRRAGQGEDAAAGWCDGIVEDAGIGALLGLVDEVHVLTSLAGFEALLRGRRVVTYGHPFYAGWGLTEDRIALPRRRRRLTLDELVAGVLILYPTYVSRISGRFTTPERALEELLDWRQGAAGLPFWWPWKRAVLRIATRLNNDR
jgi:capsular polysaccharide export protein